MRTPSEGAQGLFV